MAVVSYRSTLKSRYKRPKRPPLPSHQHKHPSLRLHLQEAQTQSFNTTTPHSSRMRIGSFIVAGLAAVASAIPAKQVATNIDQVTTASRELQTPAKQLSVLDGPLLLVGQGNFPVSSTYLTGLSWVFADR